MKLIEQTGANFACLLHIFLHSGKKSKKIATKCKKTLDFAKTNIV